MKFEKLIQEILGKKRFELLKFLCENADENGFIMIKISDLEDFYCLCLLKKIRILNL